jgi:hypothetical protein
MAATAMVLIAALIVAGLNFAPTHAQAKTTSNVRVAESPNSSSDSGSSHGHLKASDLASQYLHNPNTQFTNPANGQAQPAQQQPQQQQQQQGPVGQPSSTAGGAGGGANPNTAMSPEQLQQLMGMLSGTRANSNMGVGQQQQQQQGPAAGGGGPMGMISGLLNNLPLSSGSSTK